MPQQFCCYMAFQHHHTCFVTLQKLSDKFHLVAPDYLGYGNSSMPSVDEFNYTFENMAKIISKFVETIGLKNYSLYMQDYGAPIGYRLFSMYPEKVQAFIIQNGLLNCLLLLCCIMILIIIN
jgi:pimeloyl-ACP methyl ester carboxylesterase